MAKGSKGESQVDALVKQARHAVDTLEPELAMKFYSRALAESKGSPTAELLEEAAELMVQTGDIEGAKGALERCVEMAPDKGGGKWLSLAQLREGREALACYERGIALLQAEATPGSGARSRELCLAECAVAELFMTDLCMEEEAERRCCEALDRAMKSEYNGPEPLQALASLRLSQDKLEEAAELAAKSAQRLAEGKELPDYEFRVSSAKVVLLECTESSKLGNRCCTASLEILSQLLKEDDENIEIWYLMGVAFYRLEPPDLGFARQHLETAASMLEEVRGPATELQERVVREQLQLVAEAEEAGGQDEEEEDEGEQMETD
ncbi:unnamed protein product [Chrysoparadoxa australica]